MFLGYTFLSPSVMTNILKKVFNWSEVHLSEVTFYKIHTLGLHLFGNKSNLIDIPITLSHAVRAECSCEQGSMMELTKQFLATFYCLVCHVLTVHSWTVSRSAKLIKAFPFTVLCSLRSCTTPANNLWNIIRDQLQKKSYKTENLVAT